MLIYPAIDLRGGCCVRLRQGDYAQETIFDDDPIAVARRWEQQGADGLHLVDLDGAKAGHPVNGETIQKITSSVSIPCQVGGGLRDDSHVAEALRWGVRRIVLGTRALKDPAWMRGICERHGGRVVLGLDARDGRVATHGWLETSSDTAVEVARRTSAWPLAAIVYTDIRRDGMMEGPNFEALSEMRNSVAVPVFASGGVTTIDDVARLAALKLDGCIIGRALHEGRIDLAAAVKVTRAKKPVT
jgi:phosphoribosylformimino-5-aminoimidazole carboxamide ribotide isomerase